MSLQFILGNSGFGKTTYLYEKIIQESLENPTQKYFCIVPEQFTMQTQRDFVNMHPRKGISQIDVSSFQRLAFRVLEEVGENQRVILEETGKNMVLRKIAQKRQDQLKILGKNMKRPGYISQVKSMISELTQYQVTPEQLEQMSKRSAHNPLLSYKLQDLLVIYEDFLEYMSESYLTSEQVLQVFAQVLDRSRMLKDSVVILDGFTAFSPIQLDLIKGLLKIAKKVYITAAIDHREDPYMAFSKTDLFYLSKKMIQSVTGAAKELHVLAEEPVWCHAKGKHRFWEAEDLAFLEQHIFRSNGGTFSKAPKGIFLAEYPTAADEIQGAVCEIHRLVRQEGFRYGEIAMVLGNTEYQEYTDKLLKAYEIPCFMDEKSNAMSHPLVEYLRALMQMLEENFNYESVFRYLRSGFSGFSMEEVDILENYVLAMGIRGALSYSKSWIRKCQNQTEEQLEKVNEIRQKFWDALEFQVSLWKEPTLTVRERCASLYEFLEKQQIESQLKAWEQEFESQGDLSAAKEYDQIFPLLMDLLDKYVELLGEEPITTEEFIELLDAGFGEVKIGMIPPGNDRVVVGDLERTRIKDVKVLFFLGVNEGNIPKGHTGGGILSQMEREWLEGEQMNLAPTAKEEVYLQKFYLYYALTKPSQKLYVSYANSDFHGMALRPSYLKEVFQKLYPHLVLQKPEPLEYEKLETQRQGFSYLVKLLSADQKEWKETEIKKLLSWYEHSEIWKEPLEQLWKNITQKQEFTSIGAAAAKAVYEENPLFSVTRLERYAACAYAHFLQYGLGLRERELFEFAAVDMGMLLHKAVECYMRKLKSQKLDWQQMKDSQRDQLAEECVEEVIVDYRNTILQENARNEYMITRMKRLVKRTIWALTEQLKRGNFVPEKLEVPFYVQEEKICLRGRIDRIDICQAEDQVLVRVIDYKSGAAGFDLKMVHAGLQLQLAVYLNAALDLIQKEQKDKQIVPAGLFYFPMKDPMLESENSMEQEQIEQGLFRAMAMDGLVNEEEWIISKMDCEFEKRSDMIPVVKNKDGSFGRGSKTASTEDFMELGNFVKEKIHQMGQEIMEGRISLNPYKDGRKTACDYCSYGGICKFSQKESEFRRLEK